MPRTPRVDAPGAFQHVMMRGIERRTIFQDDSDRENLLERLERLVPDGLYSCFGWALMPNHLHLVVQTGPTPLAQLVARLGTGYAGYYNRRHGRVGHLFQNRYLSQLVTSERQLLTLVRYVHLNPVRAGLVSSLRQLERYPWTGHSALVGRAAPRFLAVEAVLRRFGHPPQEGRAHLRDWMEAAATPATPRNSELAVDRSVDLDGLLHWACQTTSATPDAVLEGSRAPAACRARELVAYFARVELAWTTGEIADALAIHHSSASRAITRGRVRARDLRVTPRR